MHREHLCNAGKSILCHVWGPEDFIIFLKLLIFDSVYVLEMILQLLTVLETLFNFLKMSHWYKCGFFFLKASTYIYGKKTRTYN